MYIFRPTQTFATPGSLNKKPEISELDWMADNKLSGRHKFRILYTFLFSKTVHTDEQHVCGFGVIN